MMNKALFLDRDGTVIEHVHYLKDPNQVRLVERCAEALRRARDAGYLLIVISNQSMVGRGTGTVEHVEACNTRMIELLAEKGVALDAVRHCPHAPEDGCSCRKPEPGLLNDCAAEFDIDLERSTMIGDNVTDVEAGVRAGCKKNYYLNTREPRENGVATLFDAIHLMLSEEKG